MALEKFEDAEVFYNKLLQIDPTNTNAIECLAKLKKRGITSNPITSNTLKDKSIIDCARKKIRGETSAGQYLVSAIVSTYNSEKYLCGCLEDLTTQTISDHLEIIVVNSGSEQNEETIVKEFQEKYSNIKYIKTENRESVYAAWNLSIKAASGNILPMPILMIVIAGTHLKSWLISLKRFLRFLWFMRM